MSRNIYTKTEKGVEQRYSKKLGLSILFFIVNYMFNEQSATPPIINDTDMKYYLSKGHSEIIYKYEADGGKRPTGKDLKVMEVWTNNPYPNPTVNDQYFHNYTLFYGVEIENPH